MKNFLYLTLALPMMLQTACTGLFYHPSTQLHLTPSQVGLNYEDVTLTQENSPNLNAWFFRANKEALGTVLHLHGNAQNMGNHLASVYWLPAHGFNLLMLDYQGFGHSEGSPSPTATTADAVRAYEYLLQRKDVDESKLILLGQSIGGSIALHSAANELKGKFQAVVVESPFAGYRMIAEEKLKDAGLPGLLARAATKLIIDSHSPLKTIDKIAPTPLLIIHTKNDEVVPTHHGKLLFDAALEPKAMWVIPEIGHIETFNDLLQQKRLRGYMTDILQGTGQENN